MQRNNLNPFLYFILVLVLVSISCSTFATPPTPTRTLEPSTPASTATDTPIPTNTLQPSPTPKPTRTPNLAATQHAQELNAEVQAYFEQGFLKTTNGRFRELDDFSHEWAQLGWYQWLPLLDSARDFFLSGHFKWESAYRSADTSGCGFIFASQPDEDHYAVFLDRIKVLVLMTDHTLGFSRQVGTTRGTGLVKFDNPADHPVEADFTVIVKDAYAYVLVNQEVVGEYTLAQSRSLQGNLGLTVLSGTNKDYGTRCEMTNLHLWIPKE